MITQDFLTEFELSLIRSYARAARLSSGGSSGIVETARKTEGFTTAFMDTFQQRHSILERHIALGGHRDPSAIVGKVQRLVEHKLKNYLFQKGNKLDRGAFDMMARELKVEVRTLFYGQD